MIQNIATLLYLSESVTFSYIKKICECTDEDIINALPQIDAYLAPLGLQILQNVDEISIVTHASQASLIEKFWREELRGELSPSSLQVLTLVAYLDNASASDISYVRGVNSTQSIRTLCVKGLIKKNENTYLLTTESLKYLGVTKKEDLPDYTNINMELNTKISQVHE